MAASRQTSVAAFKRTLLFQESLKNVFATRLISSTCVACKGSRAVWRPRPTLDLQHMSEPNPPLPSGFDRYRKFYKLNHRGHTRKRYPRWEPKSGKPYIPHFEVDRDPDAFIHGKKFGLLGKVGRRHIPSEEAVSETAEYPKVVPPPYFRGVERIKYEREMLGLEIQALPSAEQKIDAVNPFERDWTRPERRWHREWRDQPLFRPRYAWRLCGLPNAYGQDRFYQFVTKTHVVDGLPAYYEKVDVDNELPQFSEAVLDRWLMEMTADCHLRPTLKEEHKTKFSVGLLLEHMWDAAHLLFAPTRPFLAKAQVDWSARSEAFWIRGGFGSLYPKDEKKKEAAPVLVGDCRQKYGELVFAFREKPFVQLRHELPLPEFVSIDDSLCRTGIEKCIYSPKFLGIEHDKDPLFMEPGVQYGDLAQFGSLVAVCADGTGEKLAEWDAEPEHFNDCFLSAGISHCFSTLVGHAHHLGFTQYSDLTYPLTTQAIVTDGRTWEFFAYQLNTLSLLNHWDEDTQPCNVCWRSGPLTLAFGEGKFSGQVEKILQLSLQFLLNKPSERMELENYRPYVTQLESIRKNPVGYSALDAHKREVCKDRVLKIKEMPPPVWRFEEVAKDEERKQKEEEALFRKIQQT